MLTFLTHLNLDISSYRSLYYEDRCASEHRLRVGTSADGAIFRKLDEFIALQGRESFVYNASACIRK